jgi:hypothetical protein
MSDLIICCYCGRVCLEYILFENQPFCERCMNKTIKELCLNQ